MVGSGTAGLTSSSSWSELSITESSSSDSGLRGQGSPAVSRRQKLIRCTRRLERELTGHDLHRLKNIFRAVTEDQPAVRVTTIILPADHPLIVPVRSHRFGLSQSIADLVIRSRSRDSPPFISLTRSRATLPPFSTFQTPHRPAPSASNDPSCP